MKRLLVLILAAWSPAASAKVWVSVYQHDGKTPLAAVDADHPNVYRDIMVGTRLTLVIRSDSSAHFMGSLRLSWQDANYARLSGRGLTRPLPPATFPTYKDSSLSAAGTNAYVGDDQDSNGIGLTFVNDTSPHNIGIGGHPAYPGGWFVVDYYAEQIGTSNVGLYESQVGPEVLIQTLSFTHVPSRDFNHDAIVNFIDFARLASHRHSAGAPDCNQTAALDLNADGRVDLADLAAFSERWLEQIDSPATPAPARGFAEGWESAAVQVYSPGSTINGAAGSWLVGDTISRAGSCGESPQRVEVLADNGQHVLQLRSVDSLTGCEDNVAVSLRDINGTNIGFAVPLTIDTVISFNEVGELTDPQLRSSGEDCLLSPFSPCYDNISLVLGDDRGNVLVYVLQRSPEAVVNGPNSKVTNRSREIFLDPDAGGYRRNLFTDFQTIPAFYPVNARITSIAFRVDQHGWAILDDLVIGPRP